MDLNNGIINGVPQSECKTNLCAFARACESACVCYMCVRMRAFVCDRLYVVF